MASRPKDIEWAIEVLGEAIKGIYKPNAPLDELADHASNVHDTLQSINKNLDRIASALETLSRKA